MLWILGPEKNLACYRSVRVPGASFHHTVLRTWSEIAGISEVKTKPEPNEKRRVGSTSIRPRYVKVKISEFSTKHVMDYLCKFNKLLTASRSVLEENCIFLR